MSKVILAVATGYLSILAMLGIAYRILLKWLPGRIPKYGTVPELSVLVVGGMVCVFFGALGSAIVEWIVSDRLWPHRIALATLIVVVGLIKPIFAAKAEPLSSHLTWVFTLAAGALIYW